VNPNDNNCHGIPHAGNIAFCAENGYSGAGAPESAGGKSSVGERSIFTDVAVT
jgi:hypothetical protein